MQAPEGKKVHVTKSKKMYEMLNSFTWYLTFAIGSGTLHLNVISAKEKLRWNSRDNV